MGNLRMNADQISYKGGEKPMSVEEAIKNAGNTGLAHTADIAPDFSTESAYSAGDYVYHNGTLYVFTSNHVAGAWSTSDTQAVTVGGEIATLTGEAADLYSGKANQITIAPFFSAEASYDPGDLVYYNGLSYRCVNAHEGAWDADDFAATTIANELDELKSGLTGLETVTVLTVTPVTNANYELSPYSKGYTKAGVITLFLDITCTTPETSAFVKIGSINGVLRTTYGTVICEVNGTSTLTISLEDNGDIMAIYGEATKEYRNTLTAII